MANTTIIDTSFNAYIEDDKNSKKYYLAFGTYLPTLGDPYQCQKPEISNPNIINFSLIETTTVFEIKKIANDVYLISTLNSYYFVKILNLDPENSHFAIIRKHPEIGSSLTIFAFEYLNGSISLSRLSTSEVVSFDFLNGIYKVNTLNSTYYCLPFF